MGFQQRMMNMMDGEEESCVPDDASSVRNRQMLTVSSMRALYFAIPLALVIAGCGDNGLVDQNDQSGQDVQQIAIHQSIYPGFFDPDSVTVRKNIQVEITLTTEEREHVNLVSILPWVSSIEVNPPGTPTLIRFVPDEAGTFKIRNIGHGFEGTIVVVE